MAAHSSILAWKIPWIEEPGRQFRGCKELVTTEPTNTHVVNIQPFIISPVLTLLALILSLRFAPKVSTIFNYLLFPPCKISLCFSTSYSLWQDHLTLCWQIPKCTTVLTWGITSSSSCLWSSSPSIHAPPHLRLPVRLGAFPCDCVTLLHLWYSRHTAL